jgi:hypothetical protein
MNNPALIVLPAPGSSASREAQRLTREHGLVDSRYLVRAGFDERSVNSKHRVEQMRQLP